MERGRDSPGFQRRPDAWRVSYRTLELALDLLREPSARHLWICVVAERTPARSGHRTPTVRSPRRDLARHRLRAADAGAFLRPGMGLDLVAFPPLLRREPGCFAGGTEGGTI